MNNMMKNITRLSAIAALASGLSACAGDGFVSDSFSTVDTGWQPISWHHHHRHYHRLPDVVVSHDGGGSQPHFGPPHSGGGGSQPHFGPPHSGGGGSQPHFGPPGGGGSQPHFGPPNTAHVVVS